MVETVKRIVRWTLAALFGTAGVLHFTMRDDFAAIVPPQLPNKEGIVWVTGVMEMIGGLGLIVPATRRGTGIGMMLFLIAVFPANVYGARHLVLFRGQRHPPLSVRFPLQVLLIALLWWSTQGKPVRTA